MSDQIIQHLVSTAQAQGVAISHLTGALNNVVEAINGLTTTSLLLSDRVAALEAGLRIAERAQERHEGDYPSAG